MPAGMLTMIGHGRSAEDHDRRSCSPARKWCCSRCPARSRRPATRGTCRASCSTRRDFKAKGVDTVACMAVNDVFVMKAWGKASAVEDKVLMLADGNAEYAKALGLELDATRFRHGHPRPAVRADRRQRRREGRVRRGPGRVQGLERRARPRPALTRLASEPPHPVRAGTAGSPGAWRLRPGHRGGA